VRRLTTRASVRDETCPATVQNGHKVRARPLFERPSPDRFQCRPGFWTSHRGLRNAVEHDLVAVGCYPLCTSGCLFVRDGVAGHPSQVVGDVRGCAGGEYSVRPDERHQAAADAADRGFDRFVTDDAGRFQRSCGVGLGGHQYVPAGA
jgi:hypothetical protein